MIGGLQQFEERVVELRRVGDVRDVPEAAAVFDDLAGDRRMAGPASQPEADEFATLQPNRTVLEQLAQKTGGEMTSLGSLDRFVGELPTRKAPITETWYSPLWHQPWMFLLAMVCLAAEVGLRRWKGLP